MLASATIHFMRVPVGLLTPLIVAPLALIA
jgi:hypothetical protein